MALSLRAVAAHRVLLPLVVFAAITGSGVALTLRPPVYEAQAQVVITPLSADDAPVGMPVFRDLGDPIRTIETAAALLDDRRAAELAATRLGEPWTAISVAAAVTVTPQGQTNIVNVTAQAGSPGRAAAVANAFMTASLDLRSKALAAASTAALSTARQQVADSPAGSASAEAAQERYTTLELLKTYGDPSATEAQDAVPPVSAAGPPPVLVLGLAAVAGLMAAVALVVVLGASSRGPRAAAPPAARAEVDPPVAHHAGRRVAVGGGGRPRDAEPA